jgi:hypothetical protein
VSLVPGTTLVTPSVLVMARSAWAWGVSVALALLLAVVGSNWSASLMVPVLVCATGLTTVAVMLSVCGAPGPTVPTSQNPVMLS